MQNINQMKKKYESIFIIVISEYGFTKINIDYGIEVKWCDQKDKAHR
jgi:hypothetical protein